MSGSDSLGRDIYLYSPKITQNKRNVNISLVELSKLLIIFLKTKIYNFTSMVYSCPWV